MELANDQNQKMETSVSNYNIIDLKDISFDAEISTTGSRNKVYRATWQKSARKQKVAAKCCQRFHEEEVLILARMNHDNIIKFLGVVKPTSVLENYFIVTEYAEGGSLYDVISQHREDWPEFRQSRWMRWAQDGAKALQYIHEKKYQHGDVKSPNFLVTSDETLKICDFGISRQCDYTISTVTNRGSSPWMAPEAFGDVMYDSSSTRKPCKVTTKSDVYSFGVVMWELISGEAPYSNKMPMQILTAVVINKDRLEIPHDSPEHQQMSDLLNKCWQADYTQRPSIQEVLQSLIDIDNGCKKILGKRRQDTEEDDSAQPPSKKVTTGDLPQFRPASTLQEMPSLPFTRERSLSMRQNTEVIPLSKLYHIATAIRHHWKMIARHVRDNQTLEADFEAIILNHADPAKQALQMLFQWRERWPNVICTWGRLHNALWDLNLDMIAKKCNQVYLTYKYEGSPLRQGRVKLHLGIEEPAFIPVGTDVKARYRGALCDAKVKTIEKAVQCKVRFFSDIAYAALSADLVKGDLKVGAMVEARHPTENTWMDGWIVKVTDNSIYTVVYDDGDEGTLGRSSLHLHDKNKMQRRELPFLPVGTAVKVMYRGALCEAKVKTINKSMKCRISFFDIIADAVVTDDCIKGDLKVGAVVEARHPMPDTWMDGMIMKLADDSTYTVVFNDGDEKTLKRSSLFL